MGDNNSHSQWVEKGLAYKKGTRRERLLKNNNRLVRKHNTMGNLLFYRKNIIAMEEKMKQCNNLFKMLLHAQDEYNQLLGDDKRDKDPKMRQIS